MAKTPFYVVQDFVSPKKCEEILSKVEFASFDVDRDGNEMKMERHHDEVESFLFDRLKEHVPAIERTYDVKYRGTEKMRFQQYPESKDSKPAEPHGCENSKFIKRKWVKYRDVDLVGVMWLKDFNDRVPLDPRHEVYGGRLEFPLYNFNFAPKRGTLVVYPAGPHFVTATSPILVGSLSQVKIGICVSDKEGLPWFYDGSAFAPKDGKYIEAWLSEHV